MWWLILCIHVTGPYDSQNNYCSENVNKEASSYLQTPQMTCPNVRPAIQSREFVSTKQWSKKEFTFVFLIFVFFFLLAAAYHLILSLSPKTEPISYVSVETHNTTELQAFSQKTNLPNSCKILYMCVYKNSKKNNVHDKQLRANLCKQLDIHKDTMDCRTNVRKSILYKDQDVGGGHASKRQVKNMNINYLEIQWFCKCPLLIKLIIIKLHVLY